MIAQERSRNVISHLHLWLAEKGGSAYSELSLYIPVGGRDTGLGNE